MKITTKSPCLLTSDIVQKIKEQPIYFNGLDNYYWFFDFKYQGAWISSVSINSALNEIEVEIRW